MTLTYYIKRVNGRLYPKERRTNPKAAYCVDVSRVDGKVVSKYLGIKEAPKGAETEVKGLANTKENKKRVH